MEWLNQLRKVLGIAEKDVTIIATAERLIAERDNLKRENARLTEKLNDIRRDAAQVCARLDWVPTKKTTKKQQAEYKASTSTLVRGIITSTYADGEHQCPRLFPFMQDHKFDMEGYIADKFSRRLAEYGGSKKATK